MTGARVAGGILTAVAVVWLVIGLGLIAVIGLEALTLSDQNCPVPEVDALEGESSWQWVPPGEACSLHGATFSEPPASRTWLIAGELVVGVGLLVVWRRLRDAPEPDWAA